MWRVGLLGATVLLLLVAAPAQARQLLDNSELGHGRCLLSTDAEYGHPIPWPRPACIINLSPGVERLQQGSEWYQRAQVPGHAPKVCVLRGGPDQRPVPCDSANPGSTGSGSGGGIIDPLRWPQWFVPEP